MRKRVIVDCDNTMGLPGGEIDDGLVILYLLGREDIELLGVTNTFGNGSLQDVGNQTVELLRQIGRSDIPRFNGEVYDGQNPGLALDLHLSDRYDGEAAPHDFPSDAARFLVEMVNKHPNQISILGIGPVGNLYDAFRLDNEFYNKAAEIVLMGGYTSELVLAGGPCRELNLSCNPQAAFSVLHAGCPVVVFNGHICLQARFGMEEMSRIDMWPPDRVEVVRSWLAHFTTRFGEEAFYLWDLLPALYLSYPELFDLKDVPVAPTVQSLHHGMLQPVSNDGSLQASATITMPDNIVDPERFMDLLEEGWRGEWERETRGWSLLSGGVA